MLDRAHDDPRALLRIVGIVICIKSISLGRCLRVGLLGSVASLMTIVQLQLHSFIHSLDAEVRNTEAPE